MDGDERCSGSRSADSLSNHHGTSARDNRSRVLLQNSGSGQRCRCISHSRALLNVGSDSGGAQDSAGDHRSNDSRRSDSSKKSAVSESRRAEGLKSGVLDVDGCLVDSAVGVTLLGVEAWVGSVGEGVRVLNHVVWQVLALAMSR